jgi:predicted negative regulator of RcsB-dependent stress response
LEYTQNHKTTATENASILYERLLVNAQEHKNIDSFPEHQNTSYGELVALLQAKEALEKNDFDTAIHHFNWVISHTKNASLKQISETRLARVLVAKNQ